MQATVTNPFGKAASSSISDTLLRDQAVNARKLADEEAQSEREAGAKLNSGSNIFQFAKSPSALGSSARAQDDLAELFFLFDADKDSRISADDICVTFLKLHFLSVRIAIANNRFATNQRFSFSLSDEQVAFVRKEIKDGWLDDFKRLMELKFMKPLFTPKLLEDLRQLKMDAEMVSHSPLLCLSVLSSICFSPASLAISPKLPSLSLSLSHTHTGD